MPRDDREQNFEKALARGLSSPHSAYGDAARGDDAHRDDCLDAETLAAYHERLLDPEEMAQRKAHIASCARCQEILAQLESTDTIPVEADRDLLLDQIVLDLPEHEAAPAPTGAAPEIPEAEPQSDKTAPTATPAPPPDPEIVQEPEFVAATTAASATPSVDLARQHTLFPSAAKSVPSSATITFHSARQDRPKMVRFVALAGAIAAGLIFWLVYRDHNQQIDVAQNRPPSKLELPPQSPAPPPPVENKDATPKSQTFDPNAATPQSSTTPAASPLQTPSQAQPTPAQPHSETDAISNSLADAKKTIDSAKALQQKARSNAGDAAVARSGKPARDDLAAANLLAARAVPQTVPGTNARQLNAANEPSISPLVGVSTSGDSTTNLPSGIPATPPPARTKMNPGVISESVTGDAAPAVAQVSTAAPSDASSKPINGRVLTTLTPLSVPSPSGTTLWRIGQAGMIQRSTDSGTTWSIQPSGVVTDLIAGSAYSDQICWLVGRNGTVLRTTNGGASWQKLTSPSNVDLLSIFAINADSATITDAAGRAFETTSGGAHWIRTKLP